MFRFILLLRQIGLRKDGVQRMTLYLAILSLGTASIPCLGFFAIIPGVGSIILACLSMYACRNGKDIALWKLKISIIIAGIGVLMAIFWLILVLTIRVA